MNNFNIKNVFFQDNNIEIDNYYSEIKNGNRIHIIRCHSISSIKPDGCKKCGGVRLR